MNFNYLIDKINKAKFRQDPFKHVYIENFFHEDDFHNIISNSEIKIKKCKNDEFLFSELFKKNYKILSFPGTTTNYKEYIKKHKKNEPLKSHSACESAGIVLRLDPKNTFLIKLNNFIKSDKFNVAIANKFDIDFNSCRVDTGIQKYLDGYEISPHPDSRNKAATFMININPSTKSELYNHHTHYLKFKKEFNYIREFWDNNPYADRAWVPWDWCTTKFLQTKNNSIVLFSPSNDTIHAVKASYNHLSTQRTQLYGNLWYLNEKALYAPEWDKIVNKNFKGINNVSLQFRKYSNKIKQISKSVFNYYKLKDPNVTNRK